MSVKQVKRVKSIQGIAWHGISYHVIAGSGLTCLVLKVTWCMYGCTAPNRSPSLMRDDICSLLPPPSLFPPPPLFPPPRPLHTFIHSSSIRPPASPQMYAQKTASGQSQRCYHISMRVSSESNCPVLLLADLDSIRTYRKGNRCISRRTQADHLLSALLPSCCCA